MTTQQTDQEAALLELLKRMPGAAPVEPVSTPIPAPVQPTTRSPRRPRNPNGYTDLLGKLALFVALVLIIGLWYLGGAMTLAALASWDVPIATWGLLAWLIPLGITALEIGTLAGRARLPILWVVWAAVLAFDVATTAVGVLNLADGRRILTYVFTADNTGMAISGLLGIVVALVPEPSARALIKELLS